MTRIGRIYTDFYGTQMTLMRQIYADVVLLNGMQNCDDQIDILLSQMIRVNRLDPCPIKVIEAGTQLVCLQKSASIS